MDGAEVSGSERSPLAGKVKVKRETVQAVLEQCQRALELLKNVDDCVVSPENDKVSSSPGSSASSQCSDFETTELCDLLKSRVGSPNFLEKLGSIHMSASHNLTAEEGSSWDVVNDTDLWEGGQIDGQNEADQESYVLVKQEDIVEGIACFMAAYLLSLKQTKDLTPNQLQDALSKTFSVEKKKGKLRKAWEGSKVIYNIASWGATAVGIYQNPALFRAASVAFWTSCGVISKLL